MPWLIFVGLVLAGDYLGVSLPVVVVVAALCTVGSIFTEEAANAKDY